MAAFDSLNPKIIVKGVEWYAQQFASFEEFELFLAIKGIDLDKLKPKDLAKIEITKKAIAYVVMHNTSKTSDYTKVQEYIDKHLGRNQEQDTPSKMVIEWTTSKGE